MAQSKGYATRIEIIASLMAVACLATFAWAEDKCNQPTCDCTQPNAATQACTSGTLCAGQNAGNCIGKTGWEIATNFPTGCKYGLNTNCNEPLEECIREVSCKWDGSCSIDDTKAKGPWQSSGKPTIADCPPPP
jgi:hypothetical protein